MKGRSEKQLLLGSIKKADQKLFPSKDDNRSNAPPPHTLISAHFTSKIFCSKILV